MNKQYGNRVCGTTTLLHVAKTKTFITHVKIENRKSTVNKPSLKTKSVRSSQNVVTKRNKQNALMPAKEDR